jgi:hypothetical protein
MILTIFVIIFVAFIFMNLLPIYSNHTAVRNAVNDGLDKSNPRAVPLFENISLLVKFDDSIQRPVE